MRWQVNQLTSPDGEVYDYQSPMTVLAIPHGYHQGGKVIQLAKPTYGAHELPMLRQAVSDAVAAGLEVESVGHLGVGSYLFATFRLDEEIVDVGNFTKVTPRLVMGTSMDGSMSTFVRSDAVLAICDNTARMNENAAQFRIRHTSKSVESITPENIGQACDLTLTELGLFRQELERMGNTTFGDDAFASFLDQYFPISDEDSDRTKTTMTNKRVEVNQLWFNDRRTIEVHGTLLGAWQTMSTYHQWGTTVRGNTDPIGRRELAMTKSTDWEPEFWRIASEMVGFETVTV